MDDVIYVHIGGCIMYICNAVYSDDGWRCLWYDLCIYIYSRRCILLSAGWVWVWIVSFNALWVLTFLYMFHTWMKKTQRHKGLLSIGMHAQRCGSLSSRRWSRRWSHMWGCGGWLSPVRSAIRGSPHHLRTRGTAVAEETSSALKFEIWKLMRERTFILIDGRNKSESRYIDIDLYKIWEDIWIICSSLDLRIWLLFEIQITLLFYNTYISFRRLFKSSWSGYLHTYSHQCNAHRK